MQVFPVILIQNLGLLCFSHVLIFKSLSFLYNKSSWFYRRLNSPMAQLLSCEKQTGSDP